MIGKTFRLGFIFYVLTGLCFVSSTARAEENIIPSPFPNMEITTPRTTRSAELFSVEAASRCSVRFDEQDLITTVPFKNKAFRLASETITDDLPKFMVTGFTFSSLPVDKALYKLVHEAGIQVVAAPGVYPVVSGKDLKGDLTAVINKITSTAGVFYSYDAKKKYLKVLRTGKFRLYVPDSRLVMIAVLDSLRGAGVRDVFPDWEHNTISFTGDGITEKKIAKLVGDFDDGTSIITFDATLYRITPKEGFPAINWQRLVDRFGADSIRSSTKSILGRMIVSSDGEISNKAFIDFVRRQANVTLISQGLVMVPENWRSRFDIGRCGDISNPESSVSILVRANAQKNGIITGSLALDTKQGELTNFPSFTADIGDSMLIFGIPSSVISPAVGGSELALLLSPKIIRIVRESYSW